ncbi:permease [Paenibacillus thalictri]|uniref:Permease n=1 Tax=Paenibacillus thalictri TaxID=2527873 RepID=A0A4Q9DKB5_9BACL|nr:permease [Paenibacillus thalictri]TBL74018.1 permease [Paenibacillus thalictri]
MPVQTTITRIATNVLALMILIMLYLIYTQKQPPDLSFLTGPSMQTFKTLLISIILEALPFVLLGVVVSSVLQVFVSEQTIRKWIPKNPVLGILFACLMGIIFPLCECGMIPVVRRLMQKGMPVYVAVVFILVGPIINPVVYASTYMAFRNRPEIAYSRMGLAFAAALAIGLIIYRFIKNNPLRLSGADSGLAHLHHADHADGGHGPIVHQHHDHGGHHHHHGHSHTHHHGGKGLQGRLLSVLGHASDEFFDMGKYLIFGACITALLQTSIPRESLAAIGQGPVFSHLFMMGLAFALSLCSTSDAFVASSFATTFSTGSLITFLVFGPMIDIKSTLMLLSTFRAKFVLKLSLLAAVVVFAGSLLLERLFLT